MGLAAGPVFEFSIVLLVVLREDDFCDRVCFKFGVPLIVLDFIDYLCGSNFIETV